jgi:hypothetical protein
MANNRLNTVGDHVVEPSQTVLMQGRYSLHSDLVYILENIRQISSAFISIT